ncbi:MAG: amidohydrolase family protein [Pseudonocardiaceae bacterium]
MGGLPAVPDPDQPRGGRAVRRRRVAEGIDYIKVFVEDGSFWGQHRRVLTPDTVAAVITAAHQHGKIVLVHADSGATTRAVLDAGADALAHYPNDPDPTGDLVAHIAAAGAFVIPTLRMPAAFDPARRTAASTDLLAHPYLGPYIDPQTRHFMTMPPPPPPADAPAEFTTTGLDFTGALHITANLHTADVALLAGTDAIPIAGHGVMLHRELELLVEAGLTPTQAVTAATAGPAEKFQLPDRGGIAVGLTADLLLVTGDPTTDITATRNITRIWRHGQLFDRESYRTQLNTQTPTAEPNQHGTRPDRPSSTNSG